MTPISLKEGGAADGAGATEAEPKERVADDEVTQQERTAADGAGAELEKRHPGIHILTALSHHHGHRFGGSHEPGGAASAQLRGIAINLSSISSHGAQQKSYAQFAKCTFYKMMFIVFFGFVLNKFFCLSEPLLAKHLNYVSRIRLYFSRWSKFSPTGADALSGGTGTQVGAECDARPSHARK